MINLIAELCRATKTGEILLSRWRAVIEGFQQKTQSISFRDFTCRIDYAVLTEPSQIKGI